MVNGQVKVSLKNNRKALFDALSNLTRKEVYVGIPQDRATRPDGDSINNAELLFIQTKGVRNPDVIAEMDSFMSTGRTYQAAHDMYVHAHGSPLMRVPPRPVLEPAIEANKKEIGKLIADASKAALDGNPELCDENLNKAGMMATNFAKAWFENPENGWPPNAESTIKKKGSNIPLIDTDEMRKAITYVVGDK